MCSDQGGIGGGKGGNVQKMCRGHGAHGPGVSARIVEDGCDKGCVHAALYKNRLFVAAIYRYRSTSVCVKAHAPYKDTDREPANFLRFECRLVRLQHNIIQCLHVKDAQVIVVGTG